MGKEGTNALVHIQLCGRREGKDNSAIPQEVRMFSAAQSTLIAPLSQRAEKGVQAESTESKARWLGKSSGKRRATLNPCKDPKRINM